MKIIIIILSLLITTISYGLDHPFVEISEGNVVIDIPSSDIVDIIYPGSVVIALKQTIAGGSTKVIPGLYGYGLSVVFYNPNDDKTYAYDFVVTSDFNFLRDETFAYQYYDVPQSYPVSTNGFPGYYELFCNQTGYVFQSHTYMCTFRDIVMSSDSPLGGEPASISSIISALPYRTMAFSNISGASVLTGKTAIEATARAYDRLNDLAATKFPFTVMSTFVDWVDLFTDAPSAPTLRIRIGSNIDYEIVSLAKFDPLATFCRYILGVYLFLLTLHSARSMFMGVEH